MRVKRKYKILYSGFSIIELAIAAIATLIVLSAVAVILVDSQRGFNGLYGSINSEIITDSITAKNRFDYVVRQSKADNCQIDSSGHWLEVYYYRNVESESIDSYARFYLNSDDLLIEYGRLNPRQTTSVETLCSNVTECSFKKVGRSAQMLLTLNDGLQTITTVSSAVMHN